MKSSLTGLILVAAILSGAAALAEHAAAPAAGHRYSAVSGLVTSITDHQENKLYIYSKDDDHLKLEAVIDLTKAGQDRIPLETPDAAGTDDEEQVDPPEEKNEPEPQPEPEVKLEITTLKHRKAEHFANLLERRFQGVFRRGQFVAGVRFAACGTQLYLRGPSDLVDEAKQVIGILDVPDDRFEGFTVGESQYIPVPLGAGRYIARILRDLDLGCGLVQFDMLELIVLPVGDDPAIQQARTVIDEVMSCEPQQ